MKTETSPCDLSGLISSMIMEPSRDDYWEGYPSDYSPMFWVALFLTLTAMIIMTIRLQNEN